MKTLLAGLYSLLLLAFSICAARADEGMWTFDNFPFATAQQKPGADITPAWLDRVRTATVRPFNCTASFVSPDGLILTNHHCAAACLEQLSSSERDLAAGWLRQCLTRNRAAVSHPVRRCSVKMEDITARVAAATSGPA